VAVTDEKKLALRAKRYGLTPFQLEALLLMKKGCWICGREPKPGKPRYIDHCHKTDRVRGVLCHKCNYRLLGRGLEDPMLHEWAAGYLRKAFDARKDL
jgi:hypothetical protein